MRSGLGVYSFVPAPDPTLGSLGLFKHWWPMQEATGQARLDDIGTADLTDVNSVAQGTGHVEAADAVGVAASSQELLGTPVDALGTEGWFVGMWVNFAALGGARRIVNIADADNDLLDIRSGVSTLTAVFTDESGSILDALASGTVTLATWYFLWAWRSGTIIALGLSSQKDTGTISGATDFGTTAAMSVLSDNGLRYSDLGVEQLTIATGLDAAGVSPAALATALYDGGAGLTKAQALALPLSQVAA